MKLFIKNNKVRTIVYITLVAVFLAGAVGITRVAASTALPGDTLYVLKTSLEQTQYNLSQDAGDRAQLKIEFAETRLGEINELVSQGRYTEIEDTVFSFESAINGALIELETVAKSDPTRASALNIEISNALSKYAQVLTTLAATVPGAVQLEVNRALESTLLADSIDLYDDDMSSEDDDMTGDDMSGDDSSYEDDMSGNDDSYEDDMSGDDSSFEDYMSGDDDSYDDSTTIGDDDSSDDMTIGDDDSSDSDHSSNSNDDDSSDDSSGNSSDDDSHDDGSDDSSDDGHSGGDDSSDSYDD